MSDPGTTDQRHSRKRSRPTTRAFYVAAAAALLVIGSGYLAHTNPVEARGATADSPPACAPMSDQPSEPPEPPEPPEPTTITTLQQAYECIFAHHYSGKVLDDRILLTAAFARFTAELQRRGVDQPTATLPKLTGDRDRDWAAFAKTYQEVLAGLPDSAELRQALATETKQAIVDSLHDNHDDAQILTPPDTLGLQYTFEGRPAKDVPPKDIRDATGPMYLTQLAPESPAANTGLKPGDIIEAVDGVPVFINGKLTAGIIDLLHPRSEQGTVKITVHRPAADTTWTVELRPADPANPPSSTATVTLLDGGIAYVDYPAFDPDAADQVLKKIVDLRASTSLRGVILDVRGNGGGRDEAVAKLLGAFVHDKIVAWDCDGKDHCTPRRTDDSVALLNLPLVVLADGRCASACDAFTAAVKDLRLGKLVGDRTAGVASGLPTGYLLDDNSRLTIIAKRAVGANGEIINDIGVAVDYQAPMTARDLSNGRDPAVEKALSLLTA